MCGRYEVHSAVELIASIFGISPEDVVIDFKPNYNVAPTNEVPVVIITDGKRRLMQCRWGFIPAWAKEEKIGFSMINARAETIAEKPAFRDAFKKQRCVIIADGFYEWKTVGKAKRPVYLHLKSGKPMAFAGLYSIWTSPEGKTINTCTVIVTNANELLEPVHDRMPVILNEDDQDKWLDPTTQETSSLLSLLKPYPSEALEMFDVSPKVNSVKNNSPELIEAIK